MMNISRAIACTTLALVLAQSVPAMAQSHIPPGSMPSIPPGALLSNPQITPQFNTPGPQIVPSQPPVVTLPTDPPDALGVR